MPAYYDYECTLTGSIQDLDRFDTEKLPALKNLVFSEGFEAKNLSTNARRYTFTTTHNQVDDFIYLMDTWVGDFPSLDLSIIFWSDDDGIQIKVQATDGEYTLLENKLYGKAFQS